MRVLFLTLYPETAASARYRVAQFLPHLRARGVDCTMASAVTDAAFAAAGRNCRRRAFWYHLDEIGRRFRQLLNGRGYDIVFVQKGIMSAYVRGAFGLLRRCARHIVYDIDDAVHLAPPHPLRAVWRLFEDRKQTKRLVASADLVLAGNRWLLTEAEEARGRAALWPTVVDTRRFAPRQDISPQRPYRIGWVGSPSTTACLAPALEALRRVQDAELRLVGADPAQMPCPEATMRPWSRETEVGELQAFSAGIMPLPKQEWMRGKCALKALQYMACGVPCIASPFGAALDIVRHDENGLFADSTDEWLEAFERLRDPVLRRRIGEAGRATVEAEYSLEKAQPRFLGLLESVL